MSALPPKADINLRSEKPSLLILDNIDGAHIGGLFDLVLEARQIRAFYNGICTDNLKDLWTCAFRKTTGDTAFFDPDTFYSHCSQSFLRVDPLCPDIPQMPPQTGLDDSRG